MSVEPALPGSPPFQPNGRYQSAYLAAGTNPISANIRQAIAALRRHMWMALAIVGAVVVLALISTLLDTPRYTAETSVQINDQSDEVLGSQFEGANVAAPSDWDIDRFLNTQLDVLQSRGLAERVADRLELGTSERFFAAMEVPASALAGNQNQDRSLVLDLLRANLSIDLPRATRVARISFTSTDAALSALIANAFAEEFIQANLQRRFDSTSYARDFVAEQLEEARVDLEDSERDLNDYAKSVGLIRTYDALSTDGRDRLAGTVTASSLIQLNDAAIEARADRIAAQSRWEAIQGTPLLASQPVLNNPTVQSLMTRRAELESELQTARDRYLGNHPAIARLEADLSAISRQLEATARQVRESIRAEYRAAQSAEGQLDGQVSRARGASLAEQDQSVRYNVLARQADTARSIYDGLLQRYRELNASAGIASSNVAIIDRAEPPAAPSSPNVPRNLALGLLIGLGLAGMAVFLRDQLDDVIHTPEDIEEKLDLALLGVVPRAEDSAPLDALDEPKSPIAEAYNSLRGALLYSTPQGLPKIVAVTSAQAHEGKSTTSLAIAEGFARIGMRPLLIDADLRRPALHGLLGLQGDRGLTDLLVSQDDPMSAVSKVKGRKIDLLPAGPLPPSPSELLSSPRMAQLLEHFAQSHDVVVVDGPPVLGLADAPMIASMADGTVFVVEAERGRSGSLKAALRRLRSMKPVLLGAVLTKFDPTRSGNRYSAYYGYDYYQYASRERSTAA
ncbi:polysaccharide biosynthesis tyrosine autokinase [Qipengyuania sp. XHP0207]|uniref:GumC family protein n=1 Tax=Qipengyuania sp. XHP0207 TaxID=3038078 RepID=UPI00241E13CF|nr:polysaccharide biosynthesis tyrosine autokinase [Qipengyuania sp. XHP0207]MDG5746957.1 polysaccharide biosynthesis tyrosine autokinase [Qipengyuania sp. XHP0207]